MLLTKLWTPLFLACLASLALGRETLAYTTHFNSADPPIIALSPPPESDSEPDLIYAKVLNGVVPVYAHPIDATLGKEPVRWLENGYVWVSLPETSPIDIRGELWYQINDDEYVQADNLQIFSPSTFHGTASPRPNRFAWIVFDTWTSEKPGGGPGETKQWVKRYDIVNIMTERRYKDRVWYKIANGHWVEQGKVGIVKAKARPEGVGRTDKWIEVDLYEQTLAAYEGDRMVYATLISSGLPYWQTVEGLFRIWGKNKQGKMSG
ncbi:MAG: L,D-transpeptidase family protein, partial [Anaerolineae bacterium]|nr:L,D-transpeptidase family protein [Anaerolineae bacterium]